MPWHLQQDEVTPMLKDVAFYYNETREIHAPGDNKFKLLRGTTAVEGLVVDDEYERDIQLKTILTDLENLDLDQFNYNDDEEFVKPTEKKAFSKRYAALRAFSHAESILDILERKYAQPQNPQDAAKAEEFRSIFRDRERLRIKCGVIKDILEDYKNRALLLQSPYYALLAGKDLYALPKADLEARLARTQDRYAKMYLQALIDRKDRKGHFKRGEKASKLFKKRLSDNRA